MRRLVPLVLTCVLPLLAAAQDSLPPRLQSALEDLKQRSPDRHRALERALSRRPVSARRHLQAHADHLDEAHERRSQDPERHRLTVEEQRLESEVDRIGQQVRKAAPGDPVHRLLRERLEAWFDLRQQLQRLDLAARTQRLAVLEKRRDVLETPEEDARRAWQSRLVDGGARGMRQRVSELSRLISGPDPETLEVIRSHSPISAWRLSRLARKDPDAALRALQSALRRDHELAAAVERSRVVVRARVVRIRARKAIRIMMPFMTPDGALRVPPNRQPEVEAQLREVVDAERRLVTLQLEEVQAEVVERRRLLRARAERKSTIVELKLAEVSGSQGVLAW